MLAERVCIGHGIGTFGSVPIFQFICIYFEFFRPWNSSRPLKESNLRPRRIACSDFQICRNFPHGHGRAPWENTTSIPTNWEDATTDGFHKRRNSQFTPQVYDIWWVPTDDIGRVFYQTPNSGPFVSYVQFVNPQGHRTHVTKPELSRCHQINRSTYDPVGSIPASRFHLLP